MTTDPPVFEEKPVPLYRKILAVVLLVGAAAGIVFGWHRFLSDAYPPDRSYVGPNLVASLVQTIVVVIVLTLLWPPTRRRIHRFVTRHTAPLHAHFTAAKEQRERHHAEQMAAHAEHTHHLQRIHHHLGIAPYDPATQTDGEEVTDMAKGKSPAPRAARTASAKASVTKAPTAKKITPEPTVTKKGAKSAKKA